MASVTLLVGDYLISRYSFSLQDNGHSPLFPTVINYNVCVVAQLAAVVCSIIAAKRGSHWWIVLALPAGWLAFVCLLGEL